MDICVSSMTLNLAWNAAHLGIFDRTDALPDVFSATLVTGSAHGRK